MAKVAIFFGSFLAFALELMVGKALLPRFGGAASVWVTCLCAFQTLLVLGYAYAATAPRRAIHIAVLFAAAAAIACGAVPFFVVPFAFILLSANATVVQTLAGGKFSLYAWSNLGSFAGLAIYSLAIEPFMPLSVQWRLFAVAMCLYAGLLATIRKADRVAIPADEASSPNTGHISTCRLFCGWFSLSALGCAAMMSATAFITSDISGLPLVWAAILGLYLFSFVFSFSSIGERALPFTMAAGAAATALAAIAAGLQLAPPQRFIWNALGAAVFLLISLSAIHGWLYALRPSAKWLGRYYLAIAAGGAVGGAAVAVVAPIAFDGVAEYPVCLIAVSAAIATWAHKRIGRFSMALPLLVAAIAGWNAMHDVHAEEGRLVRRIRGFYGVMSVRETTLASNRGDTATRRTLFNGRTSHGFQVNEPSLRRKPTMYYSLNGGGIAFTNHPSYCASSPMKVGMIGLGVGTLATYGRQGDRYMFYEISPEDIAIATDTNMFTYLSDSAASIDIRQGDARIELGKDVSRGERFDVLVIDAYSGDAVPLHLMTAEAFRLYRRAVNDDGVIAVHLSNWHLNLWPLMKAAAAELGWSVCGLTSDAVLGEFAAATDWAFLTGKPLSAIAPLCCRKVDWSCVKNVKLPTDDMGSILPFIHFNYAPPVVDDVTQGD